MSVVEQRYRAVLAVLGGASAGEVAASIGVSRQTVQGWKSRYLAEGLGGLADRSRRPDTSPRRSDSVVETAICEMRRDHPRWGARRIEHELARTTALPMPSRVTVHRILVRHGLIDPTRRKRRRED